jgi:hypothetical protein
LFADPLARRKSAVLKFKFQNSTSLAVDPELHAVELSIPTCAAPCTLRKFSDAFATIIPGNWEEECKIDSSGTPSLSTHKIGLSTGAKFVVAVGAVVLACIMLVWCFRSFQRKSRHRAFLLDGDVGADKNPFNPYLEDDDEDF